MIVVDREEKDVYPLRVTLDLESKDEVVALLSLFAAAGSEVERLSKSVGKKVSGNFQFTYTEYQALERFLIAQGVENL